MITTMRAAVVEKFGPPENLIVREIPIPTIDDESVLVRVRYAGVQPADTAARTGSTPPGAVLRMPLVIGNEFSGTVEAVGSNVRDFRVGDEVLGFGTLGSYAEFVSSPEIQLVHKPEAVPWDVAGGLSGAGQTAHAVFEDLEVGPGDVVVVHGAAGSVGTVFTQLAVSRGARVIGTASEINHDYLRGLGATPVAHGKGLTRRIREISDHVDVVLDAAGRGSLESTMDLTAEHSRIGSLVDWEKAEELGVLKLRTRRTAERLALLAKLVANGELVIHIRRAYDLAEAAIAHREIETGHGRGKVVLKIAADG